MFGFGKPKSRAEKALAVMDDAIQFASEKWSYFRAKLPFKDGVGLADQIGMFSVPAIQGLQNNFPALREAPDAVLMLIVAKGVEKSGTHTKSEVETALGARLPG